MLSYQRGSARERGYTRRWEKARLAYLRSSPLCVMCAAQGKVTAANVVDHKVPHRGDQALFWDVDNWQSLCTPHHNSTKQSEEVLGFSNELAADGWPLDPQHPANGGKPAPQQNNRMSRPSWFRPVYIPLTIVCGAPGSGKSFYVDSHAGPTDRVICFDRIAARMFAGSKSNRVEMLDGPMVGDVLRQRNEELADLMRAAARKQWAAAWLIVSEPKPERRQWWSDRLKPRSIVVLRTPAIVCKQRVRADALAGDRRYAAVEASIDSWWHNYRSRPGDVEID
jgi:hypothetical protein